MANSSTSPIMTCAQFLHHGGYYAQVHHPTDTRPSLPLRGRFLPAAPGPQTGRQSHRRDSLDGLVRRRGADLFDLRDLPSPGRRPLRGDLRQRPLRQPLLSRARSSTRSMPPSRAPLPPRGPARRRQATAPRRHPPDTPSPIMASIPSTGREIYRSTGQRPAPARSSPTPPHTSCSTAPAVHPGYVTPGDPLRVAQGRAPRAAGLGAKQGKRGSNPACCSWTAVFAA